MSLLDVDIEELEDFLDEEADETLGASFDDDHMYQQFLSSLLPCTTSPVNAYESDDFFSVEDDDEFHPLVETDQIDEDQDGDEPVPKISRRELTDLLFDSSLNDVKPKSRPYPDIRPSLKYARIHGNLTSEQCIQLASQMHKHVQLVAQGIALCQCIQDGTVACKCKGKKKNCTYVSRWAMKTNAL